MTDLRRIAPISITGDATLEQARTNMIVCGVKLLFVKGARGEISGLITATDLAGEKSIKTASGSARKVPELSVDDVMTKASDLEFLDYARVAKAELGHIVATLKSRGRQHALVTTTDEHGDTTIIGLFSSTQIARQMGTAVLDPVKAYTFSQIEAAVSQA
jgi:CBS domain-containing protein